MGILASAEKWGREYKDRMGINGFYGKYDSNIENSIEGCIFKS